MAKFNVINTNVVMGMEDIIKYQILTHCYVNRIPITESDISCMALLAFTGEQEITEFCLAATQKRIFKSTQSVRNCIVKLERSNLIIKDNNIKGKKITLNPTMQVLTKGNILINYKIYHVDSQEI